MEMEFGFSLFLSWFCLSCLNNQPRVSSHPFTHSHTLKQTQTLWWMYFGPEKSVSASVPHSLDTPTVWYKQFIFFYFLASGEIKAEVSTLWWDDKENAILEPEKDKRYIRPGVLCKSQKGQGRLNSNQPDVLTLKVVEIEKIIHSYGWWLHLPSIFFWYFFSNPPQQFLVNSFSLICTTTTICNGEKEN